MKIRSVICTESPKSILHPALETLQWDVGITAMNKRGFSVGVS